MFPTKAAIRKDPLVNLELRDVAVSYQPLDTARFAVPAQSIELQTCQGEQLPKPVFTPSPSFTRQARANRDQATVIMHAFVAADGSVIDAQALNPTGDGLDVNARKTMLTWKFKPATCSGRPVAAEMMVEVSFKLFQQQ
jgi:TonB family protein